MSLKMITLLQIIQIFAIYSGMTVFLPAIILHKKVAKFSKSVRFMIYVISGNFYFINIVFLLQILHISNFYTLWFMTLVPFCLFLWKISNIPIFESIVHIYWIFQKLILGLLGWRTFGRRLIKAVFDILKKTFRWLFRLYSENPIEWLLFIAICVALCWIYGTNALETYGYCASDVPVHNYWLNGMDGNKIFIDGVYPFGFHCIIYFIHAAFGIDTYVLLRLFCLVQTIFVHIILFAFINALCKSRFTAFVGVGAYIMLNVLNPDCTVRYSSSLPQEFGMIFIMPSIYFLLMFFSTRKEEIGSGWVAFKRKRRELITKNELKALSIKERFIRRLHITSTSTWYLVGYLMSAGLSLAVHFYDTMIVGVFGSMVALIYIRSVFKKEYFFRLVSATIIGLGIAVLPMFICFLLGTPLQGSLTWGMNVMNGRLGNQGITNLVQLNNNQATNISKPDDNLNNNYYIQADRINPFGEVINSKFNSVKDKFIDFSKIAYVAINNMAKSSLVYNKELDVLKYVVIGVSILLIFVLLSFILRRFEYGYNLAAVSMFILAMFFILGCAPLGLPQIMDYNRCRVFLAYSLPILFSLLLDSIIYTMFGSFRKRWIMYIASLLICSSAALLLVYFNPVRYPIVYSGLETNEAITCVTHIIKEKKDFTWTIVSANDERNMIVNHGYHMELSNFIENLEKRGSKGMIKIPTKHVFFFIEKVPVDYLTEYSGSGQTVSEIGAKKSMPLGSSLNIYQGENRWIFMSKIYYWAQAFRKLYTNEMKVYFENKKFVCYEIDQNVFKLYNFSIDYGFTSAKTGEKEIKTDG